MKKQTIPDRDIRQRDIIPPDRLFACRTTVVGVGAIGRQVALQLTAVGVPWLQLIDPDEVAPENLACQGYLEEDIGCLKVDATRHLCRQINSTPEVVAIPSRFQRSQDVGSAVFCCVDSIETRRLIWRAVQDKVDIFIDGRMSAEVLRVLVACDLASREHYPTTLFSGEEAYSGSCTAKSTIYCANIAAGLMLSQFTKFLRGIPVDCDVHLNLLSTEIIVAHGQ